MNIVLKYIGFMLFLLGTIPSIAQLSPGELSNAHAHLEGLKNCTKCHLLGEKETSSKCLDCHTEIKQLISLKKGYHASSEAKGKKCAECHGEHFGRDFQITRFESQSFDHSLTGYELEGAHKSLDCTGCHRNELIVNKISQKKGETYLGLGTACLSCHADYHQQTLSNNCISCHNQEAFSPAPGFDHNLSDFPLKGKHSSLDCGQCHAITESSGIRFQNFSNVRHENCTACHQDIHNNKFGQDCKKCHNESSFTAINNLSAFNHEQTSFPLRGLHQAVDCKSCHKNSLTQPLKHGLCVDCHADYHKGDFANKGVVQDCAECHSVSGFSPSIYTFEKHALTNFTLDGAHVATPCISCHQSGKRWSFANLGIRCADCHENVHEGVISEKFYPESDCKSCHSTSFWSQIEFNHSQTDFKLEGKHLKVTCRSCHFRGQNGIFVQQFANLSNRCENCHTDIHYRQFESENGTDCARCHTSNNWEAEKFNHDDARFKIDGEHVGIECLQCHKPTDGLVKNYIRYKFEDITCASCH